MRGAILSCIPYRIRFPFFNQETDPNVSVTVTTTEPTPQPEPTPEPTPEDNKHLEIGVQVGQLQAKVQQLETTVQEQASLIQSLQSEDRWTEDRIRSLWEEMFRLMEKVEEQQEEQEPETDPAQNQIPVVPEQVQTQEDPKPEKASLWDLKRWI